VCVSSNGKGHPPTKSAQKGNSSSGPFHPQETNHMMSPHAVEKKGSCRLHRASTLKKQLSPARHRHLFHEERGRQAILRHHDRNRVLIAAFQPSSYGSSYRLQKYLLHGAILSLLLAIDLVRLSQHPVPF